MWAPYSFMAFDWFGVVFDLPHIFYLGASKICAFLNCIHLCYVLGCCSLCIASFDILERSILHFGISDK